ncbi:MAG: FHA domain-containing protein [Bacteroidota bacterium]
MAPLYQFVMRSGPTPGATFTLQGDQLIVGRDTSSAIAINDAEVSRKHARLTYQGGKYVIEDLGSTNGTFVNGQRLVSPVVLKSGDVISLGEQIVLLYEVVMPDAGETVMSARRSAPISRPAPAPRPVPAPMPPQQQYYTPQPPPEPAAMASPERTRNNMLIYVVIGVLVVVCACAAVLWYIDSNYLWCTFFPFIPGCP